jgi:hypothetical protein
MATYTNKGEFMRYTDKLAFDRYVVTYYANKMRGCKDRNIEFNLTSTQVKNMLRAKRCGYTEELLTHTHQTQIDSDVTLDRINCMKPYETGNVIAVSHKANRAKNAFESLYRGDADKIMMQMVKVINKRKGN